MSEFDPALEFDTARHRWQVGMDTFGRVYDVDLGGRSPTASRSQDGLRSVCEQFQERR